ncbi:hypothetical protein F9883_18645 [Morganella morganii]|uniref:Rha family transcriptional regulator n=1 Tax=Morganella morganii TaxID=582 RepID=UPI0015F5C2DB|nr:hypothetical protein [Morganella morganii]
MLRKIKQTISDCPDEFAENNIYSTDYIDKNCDIQPMYKLSKDGCMLLVMSFTGKNERRTFLGWTEVEYERWAESQKIKTPVKTPVLLLLIVTVRVILCFIWSLQDSNTIK